MSRFSVKSRETEAIVEKPQIMAPPKTVLAPLEQPLRRDGAKHP
jgi:hypothetical protein